MKTRILRTVCFVFIACLMNGFVTRAQESYYSTTKENGKVVSQTKYVIGSLGIIVKESESKYTYDESGDFLKKEVYAWNPVYERNNKTGRYAPDYSEGNWTPQYCVFQKKDVISNFVYVEMHLWNQAEKAYNDAPEETVISQLNDSNNYNYLAIQKGDKYTEVINNINYDRELLTGLAK